MFAVGRRLALRAHPWRSMPRATPSSIKDQTVSLRPVRPLRNLPSPDEIRLRAYQIYLARGALPGHESEDWEQAERELTTRLLVTS